MSDIPKSYNRKISPIPQLVKSESGQQLCSWCKTKPIGNGHTFFCSAACKHEWKLRSDNAYLRQTTFERDSGICSNCHRDTQALLTNIESLPPFMHERTAREMGFKWGKSFWQADHIVPVAEGGGEAGLENIQTLCTPCHRIKSGDQAGRKATRRRGARVEAFRNDTRPIAVDDRHWGVKSWERRPDP